MYFHILFSLLLFIVQSSSHQSLLGTHFYVNQDNILVDNTLKTVSTLARPYDLVAFIRQSERLARVDSLQTYIDAVDDIVDLPSTSNSDKQDNEDNIDKCNELIRDSESLIFKILKTNLYDTYYIPFELKNLSINATVNDKFKPKTIQTCNQFCETHTNLLTFDHLPSISTRYDEQQTIRIDDDEPNNPTKRNEQQAQWSIHELSHNRSSWLAYVYLSRYFASNLSYHHAIDCLRCALVHGSDYNDVVLIELANIVFRYGYIRDAIVLIEKALDYHLRMKTINVKSLFIRSILHYYLGNLCTIDNRFLLAIQFYNRTRILLEKIQKLNDEQQISSLSAKSLGSLSISSLLSLSQQKIDALRCHLTLELSLQRKHHVLQTKLAQLNQLRSITDELIQLNSLIKRDMSPGQSFLETLRKIKVEQQQTICDWKQLKKSKLPTRSYSKREEYSTVMKRERRCSINDINLHSIQTSSNHLLGFYDCRPRDNVVLIGDPSDTIDRDEQSLDSEQNLMASRIAASKHTYSTHILNENTSAVTPIHTHEQTTLTSTTTWPTLTSRLPTEVINQSSQDFLVKQSNVLYPPLKHNTVIKLNEQQLPTYAECQMHYYGLPSIGDYPTVWLPLENKGISNVKEAFYQGLNYQNKHYPLPWSPPLCVLKKPVNERLAIIENHSVLNRVSRAKAPTNRYDTNMLLNLYMYIDSIIDEQLPIEEFGQRLRSVSEKHEHLIPEWIVHLLSSLYWRVNGHLPHAIDCGLKAHETIIKNNTYKQWSDLTLINLANILYLWGKYEDALDITQQAYSINSHEPTTNYFLGNLLALTKNNHTAAQEYYRRTIAIDPAHVHAYRQLRLSYCYTMHSTWEMMSCSSDNEKHCDEKSVRSESTKRNLMLSVPNSKIRDATMVLDYSRTYSSSYYNRNTQCQRSLLDNRSSIDRWLNRSSSVSSPEREELINDARRAYRQYGLCSNNHIANECSQGFGVTNNGYDIGHVLIIYNDVMQSFYYSFVFSTDYENIFLKEGQSKCIIYGTGRKSSKCRNLVTANPSILNSKHNMTWLRDPSTIYEHLKELIEIMSYQQQFENETHLYEKNAWEKYLSDQYLFSKDIQTKYLSNNSINFNRTNCQNVSAVTYKPYLSTWISPQTKNIFVNHTFFRQLRENTEMIEPICSYPIINQTDTKKNLQLLDYIIQKANHNLTLYHAETILRPILFNLMFEKNPAITNKGGKFLHPNTVGSFQEFSSPGDDRVLLASFLASGLHSPTYNTSWIYFHTLSLYWRLMGNASQSLNCLLQSHILSPHDVHDLTYLSMALILYNSQLYINEAVYLLYESLTVDPPGLLLAHFTLGNAMARKGYWDYAEQWYRSTLNLKSDFEPAKQRLRTIQCSIN
ncbi:unnamed protein product [Adineta ricciae]|uniref:Tetratricopeptide repeat protein 17 n=1 Tax=Adineta ricciae TaxID=249248 RepID=A0A814JT90_ADIRI|nr:unnamed protein product [Adineta ricciae]